MKLVIIESPYAGNVELHERYARACLADCLSRGEAPYASHLLYTQPGVLDDTKPDERRLGIAAGFEWNRVAALTAVYTDFGESSGMSLGIKNALLYGRPIEYRTLHPDRLAAVRRGTPSRCSLCACPLVDTGPLRCIRCAPKDDYR